MMDGRIQMSDVRSKKPYFWYKNKNKMSKITLFFLSVLFAVTGFVFCSSCQSQKSANKDIVAPATQKFLPILMPIVHTVLLENKSVRAASSGNDRT